MPFYRSLCLFLILVSFSTHAFELIMIQAVSDTKRTFITRKGKRDGVTPGVTATFTGDNYSIIARALHVSGNFTQWQLLNDNATLPFEKGHVVTFYPATEYLWALAPEKVRQKYIKSELPQNRSSLVFKGALTRGLAESVSDSPAGTSTRGGYLGEIYYEKELTANLALDFGLRYEREVLNVAEASFITARNLAIINLLYYWKFFPEFFSKTRFYLGGGLGHGLSNTKTTGLSQSGPVSLLPSVKAGLSLPFEDGTWEFLVDSAFESLNTREEQATGRIQTTTQTNFKMGFGLRRFF